MFSFLNPYLFWIKLAGVAVLCAGVAGASWYITHNVDQVAYTKLQLQQSQAATHDVTASLNQLQGFIAKMDTADAGYSATLQVIAQNLAAIKKEFADATLKPLPADCRPDAGRLRVLTDAVERANKAAGTVH